MNKTVYKLIFTTFFLIVILFSCSNKKFIREFSAIMNAEMQDKELVAALLELDKKYPEKLRVKTNLATLYLGMAEKEEVEKYLLQGLTIAEKSKDKEEKYIFYANYGEYLFIEKKYKKSIIFAKKALKNGEEDYLGASLTIAQSLTNEKNMEEALSFFEEAWNYNPRLFFENDIVVFMKLLTESPNAINKIGIMVALIDEMRTKNPAMQGTGFQQAELLEQTEAPIASLIAIFSEFEYSRYEGTITNNEIFETLDTLTERVDNFPKEIQGNFLQTIEGYRSFVNGKWNEAEVAFSTITPEIPIRFFSYLKLSSMLEAGQGEKETLSLYTALEYNYSFLQGYYYHLWHGMKKSSDNYNAETAYPVLRNCILLSTYSFAAIESRIELGKLYGIENGQEIVLSDEIFYMINGIINGHVSPDVLAGVVTMFEMDDNIFIDDAVSLLKKAVKNETVGNWFKMMGEQGSSKQKSRIQLLFS